MIFVAIEKSSTATISQWLRLLLRQSRKPCSTHGRGTIFPVINIITSWERESPRVLAVGVCQRGYSSVVELLFCTEGTGVRFIVTPFAN